MISELKAACEEVDKNPDKTELNSVISAAKALKKEDYTPAAWAVFEKALKDAEAVCNNPEATKSQTAAAVAALKKAIEDVKKSPAQKPVETAKVKVKKISISGLSKKIAAGKKVKLTAKVSPSNASNKAVTWKSSNKKVATVTKKGKVKGKKAGKTYIIAKVGKKKYKCRVIVKKKSVKPIQTTKPVETTKPEQPTKPNVPEQTTMPEVPTTAPSQPDPAVNDFGYRVTGSTVTINQYKGKSTAVVIPEKINGKPVTGISETAFQESDYSAVRITSVVIPETVTSIGRLAFAYCKFLRTLEIQGNGLKTIGNQAFDQYSSLQSVKLPGTVQSMGEYAFAGCQTMTSINIPVDLVSVGLSPFSGCSNLQYVTIDEGATILPSFAYRSSLKAIVLPLSITTIEESQFSGCSGLESVEIKGAVKTIGEMAFYGCSLLKEVILPETVETIEEYAFSSCTTLEEITIPASVTNIAANAFEECTALKTIKGTKGSYAETFANNNGFTFVEK